MLGEQISAVPSAFGEVLRHARKAAGKSQETLAFDASLERNYISLLETGQNQPTITTIFKLAAALGVTPHELIRATEQVLAASRGRGR